MSASKEKNKIGYELPAKATKEEKDAGESVSVVDKTGEELKEIWNSLNKSERVGIAFGLFPARLNLTHKDCVALMRIRFRRPRMVFD